MIDALTTIEPPGLTEPEPDDEPTIMVSAWLTGVAAAVARRIR